ncbi:hypothetical protein TRFO_42133 [Tritrichomonas foetus]|uniref:Uncharacterized protein n=1 Tax=Tritrichomonas foetus TaxID=1144522 RepID=A0A1J4L278_9EUKA|nr:hypothetical protein TRFO_42133 [Tritrichomonas foetus]|eukprot:OHT15997.1 hypothetical protein TRFO_42133 [Tritrichomonas foetus]
MNFPVTFSGSSITVKTTGSVIPISTTTTTPVTLEFAKFPATLTGSLSTSVKLTSPTALSSRSKVTFAGEFGGSLVFTSSYYDIVINNYTKTPSGSDFPFTFTVGAGGLSTLTINSALTTSISQNIICIASESIDSLKKLTPSTYQLLTSPFTFTTTPELKLEKPSGVTDKIPGFEEGDEGFIEWKLDESGKISAAVKDIAHVAFRFCLGNSCESNQGIKVSNVNEISTYFKTDYKNLTVNVNGDSPSVHFAFLGPAYSDVEVNINGVNQAQTISQLNIPDAAPITRVNVLNIKAASDADEFLFSSKADAYVDTVFAQSSLSNIKKAPKSLNFNDIIVEYLEFSTTGVKITSGQIEGQTIPSFVTSPITFNLAQATASQLTYTMAEGLTSPQPVTVIFPTLETPSSYKIFLANWTQVDSTAFTMVINHGANPLEISATDSFQAEGSSHISLIGSGEVTYKNDGTVPTPLPPTQVQPSEEIPSVGPTLTGEPEPTNDEDDDSDGKKNKNVAVIASVTVVTVVIAVAIIVAGVIYFCRIRQGTGTGGSTKKEVTMSLYEV